MSKIRTRAGAVPLPGRRFSARAVAFFACILAVAATVGQPAPAYAGWPLQRAGTVTCAFGGAYSAADGSSSTHTGADVAAEDGAGVCAPFGGSVTFVGRIPGPGGGTVLAVTLATEKGDVTLFPFRSVTVVKGEQVAEGAVLGIIAGEGDPSTTISHVHVGLRRNGLYLDPMSVMAPPAVATPQPGSQPAAAAAGNTAQAGSASSAVAGSPAPSAAAVPVETAGAASRTASAGDVLAPGVTVAGSSVPAGAVGSVPVAVPAGVAGSAGEQASAYEVVRECLDNLASKALSAVRGGVRTVSLTLLAVLFALGALWPLWRGKRKGTVQVPVSALSDDVAAVAGQ
ncbi:MAG: M23 family metallopeptidase [Coriobacteriia bacterium]|nr:M23 family metallopeptidase [Coriobacteriia bacterium]